MVLEMFIYWSILMWCVCVFFVVAVVVAVFVFVFISIKKRFFDVKTAPFMEPGNLQTGVGYTWTKVALSINLNMDGSTDRVLIRPKLRNHFSLLAESVFGVAGMDFTRVHL